MTEEPGDLAPTQLDRGWFQRQVDRWCLEDLSLAEVEAFATAALTRAYDGKALAELAWRQEGWGDVNPLFERAVAEMGLELPTPEAALDRLVRAIAREVERGERPLLEGAQAIVRLRWRHGWVLPLGDAPEAFNPYYLEYLLDELPEIADPAERASWERRIADQMAELAQGPAPALPPPEADALAPELGGARAAGLPAEDPPPEGPVRDGGRTGFTWGLSFDLQRIFSWRWSSDERRR